MIFSCHTPNDPADVCDGAVLNGNVAYIGWNVFTDYAKYGELHAKELVAYALDCLLTDRRVYAALPDRGIVTVTNQQKENRDIVHLLFAHTTVRGRNIEVIEDAVPLYDTKVSLLTRTAPKSVKLVPQNDSIPFVVENGHVEFTVPKFALHQMISVEY